jgi:hypothetical protein
LDANLLHVGVLKRQTPLFAMLVGAALLTAGCGSGDHLRTEVLRATNPVTAGIYVRITGPPGAVSYVGQRLNSGDTWKQVRFSENAVIEGEFLPPSVREQKLCSSTHVIQTVDAPQLQKWLGKRLEIAIYGPKTSAIYCAVLGYGLYLGSS